MPARVWHQAFDGPAAYRPSRRLKKASVPVLVIGGDRDTYAGRADQDALMKAMPTARHIAYEGVGHAIHWEESGARASTRWSTFLGDEP